ncbi:MAG: nitroreductase family protein, partial [Microthrixaceae bacterium]|nr:nitroreductase family protein [Microthrixaceae bacterium]
AYLQRYSEPDKARSGLGADTGAWDVPYWFVDGGAAVMSLLLAAEAEGLGALLFGQFDHESRVRQALGVPEGRRAIGTVAVGHRATGDGGGSSPGAGSTDSVSRSARRGRPSPAVHVRRGRWDRSSMV